MLQKLKNEVFEKYYLLNISIMLWQLLVPFTVITINLNNSKVCLMKHTIESLLFVCKF